METIDYRAEVLKVYPEAYCIPNQWRGGDSIIGGGKICGHSSNELLAWKNAYENLPKQVPTNEQGVS